jgi:hypothetical protein
MEICGWLATASRSEQTIAMRASDIDRDDTILCWDVQAKVVGRGPRELSGV